mmetsp:Transcript_33487/g.73085  ORF Transcript_33487/g.73085 Transcript_33487/m.73085 type:complete len:354 (-) Transcript_33487:107-1168(-)
MISRLKASKRAKAGLLVLFIVISIALVNIVSPNGSRTSFLSGTSEYCRPAGSVADAIQYECERPNWDESLNNVHYFAQMNEDRKLEDKYFRCKRNGIFVELGGLDGVKFSISKYFEEQRNWAGVLIEGFPENFVKLAENRPNRTVNFPRAVCMDSRVVDFVKTHEAGVTAGNPETFSEGFIKAEHPQLLQGRKGCYVDGKPTCTLNKMPCYKVPCEPMWRMLRDASLPHIDLLTVDVEGAEETVLKSIDWRLPIHVVVVEMDGRDPAGDERIRNFMVGTLGFIEDTTIDITYSGVFVNPRWDAPTFEYTRSDIESVRVCMQGRRDRLAYEVSTELTKCEVKTPIPLPSTTVTV